MILALKQQSGFEKAQAQAQAKINTFSRVKIFPHRHHVVVAVVRLSAFLVSTENESSEIEDGSTKMRNLIFALHI